MKSFVLALLTSSIQAETLVFEDNFDKLDFTKWQHEITMGGGGNWEFEMYTNNRTNSFVKDSILYLQPTLTVDQIGDDMLNHGDLNLWGANPAEMCTGNAFYGCERNAGASGNVINPIKSARLRSYGSFSFKYGRVEIRAKLPKGDWLWPAIWLLPKDNPYGQWPASGEIDIMESRGNDASCAAGGRNKFGSTLHWGPGYPYNAYEKAHAEYTGPDLSADFHLYGLEWTATGIKTTIDGQTVLNFPFDQDMFTKGGFPQTLDNPWKYETEKSAPFNQEFYLIFNVAAGGVNGYFPDGQCGKPYSNTDPHSVNAFWNARGAWFPTWNYPATHDSAMQIDYVRVYQNSNSEATFTQK